MPRGISVGARYRAMRRVLVGLRRAAIRWDYWGDESLGTAEMAS